MRDSWLATLWAMAEDPIVPRAGDVVRVELPSGRVRVLEVLEVRYPDAAEAA